MKEQLKIGDIKEIIIWDEAPTSHPVITKLYKYILKVKDEIELWDTNCMSRADFLWNHLRDKYDDLFQEPEEWKNIPKSRDYRKILSKKREQLRSERTQFITKKYEEYTKTITSTFLKKMKMEYILLLIEGYNEIITKEDFISQHELYEEFNSTITRIHSGPSSLVQIRFELKNEKSIDIYIRTKYLLWSPWRMNKHNYLNYNSKINYAIYHILPEEGNCNKMNLIHKLKP